MDGIDPGDVIRLLKRFDVEVQRPRRSTHEGLQDQLVAIWRDRKVTVLFVTHAIDEAVYMADRVIAIGGRPGEVRSAVTIDVERLRRRGDPRRKALSEALMGGLSADAASREDGVN